MCFIHINKKWKQNLHISHRAMVESTVVPTISPITDMKVKSTEIGSWCCQEERQGTESAGHMAGPSCSPQTSAESLL